MTEVVAGMTGVVAGMTGRAAGMGECSLAGMMEKDAGMTERDANPSVIPVKTGNQEGRGVGVGGVRAFGVGAVDSRPLRRPAGGFPPTRE